MKATQRRVRMQSALRLLPAFLVLAACAACSRVADPKPAAAPAPAAKAEAAPLLEKSDSQTLVDGFTGRTAVNAGLKARDTIETVKEKQAADMSEVDKF